jgi:mannose-1-phosphate guanylyltransferase/mannose-6-phosphate isomerase
MQSMMTTIRPVILAGGTGTRLWPLSRTHYPKQFLKLNKESLFQATYRRAMQIAAPESILVVTNEVHQYLVKNQVEELGARIDDQMILREPVGRNTLPAITWAMREIRELFGESTVAIFPSDHELDASALTTIEEAAVLADRYLITFGVPPNSPQTGYGYIAPGEPVPPGYVVKEFREKPDRETALKYMNAGYLWNSGIFLFSTGTFFSELRRYQPEIFRKFCSGGPLDFPALPSVSVDYGLLEYSSRVAVVPLNAPWTDLGTFQAWYDFHSREEGENVGKAEYIDSRGNFVCAPGKQAALIGIHDTVVVDTGDALLVADMRDAERVNELVKKFRASGDPIADFHRQVHRPWGSYTELERSRFFRIKRVTVKPGKKLSLQMHHHRSEHWIVVSGTADVIQEDRTLRLRQGESTFVPAGMQHRLGNSGKIPLEVIEVQIGEYLEEDDIVRFSDDYNRS